MNTITTNLEIAIKLNNHIAAKALLFKINNLRKVEGLEPLELVGLGLEITVGSKGFSTKQFNSLIS